MRRSISSFEQSMNSTNSGSMPICRSIPTHVSYFLLLEPKYMTGQSQAVLQCYHKLGGSLHFEEIRRQGTYHFHFEPWPSTVAWQWALMAQASLHASDSLSSHWLNTGARYIIVRKINTKMTLTAKTGDSQISIRVIIIIILKNRSAAEWTILYQDGLLRAIRSCMYITPVGCQI